VPPVVRFLLCLLCLLPAFTKRSNAQGSADFYHQKTIRFAVTYEPGGSYDIYARLVTAHMGRHIPGNPAFNVQYMPGAGGLIGILHLYEKAAQDGTEMAILPRDLAINQMLRPEQARYDARRYNWIGTISTYAGLMFIASRTGVKTAMICAASRWWRAHGVRRPRPTSRRRCSTRWPERSSGWSPAIAAARTLILRSSAARLTGGCPPGHC
jgi:tripartite-type tricarboxylate transporter receptor subunit TctC